MTRNKWSDLRVRTASAVVLLIVFLVALSAGRIGILFFGFVVIVAMQWELAQIFGLSGRRLFAVTAVAVLGWLPIVIQPLVLNAGLMLPTVAGYLPILIGAALVRSQRGIYACYGAFLTFGIVSFWYIALNFGSFGISVLAVLVVLSDISGYLAGRMIGGPKFWPSISPKKTWSGTIAGWIFTGVFGAVLVYYSGMIWMIPVAIFVAFGSQVGDISESWIKRRMGVKDSSNLIPGHGGFLDRFDGFIGGAGVLGITSAIFFT